MSILVATAFFLLILALVRGAVRGEFAVATKVARGVAASLLVTAGVFSVVRWFGLWPQAFLVSEERGGLSELIVCFLTGHLVADLLWFAYGRWSGQFELPADLVAHHVQGLVLCALPFLFGAGFILVSVVLTTELMPVATGLGAWGKLRGRPEVLRFTQRFSLFFLLAYRLPLWGFLFLVTAWNLHAAPSAELDVLRWIALLGYVLIVALDAYWSRAYARQLKKDGAVQPALALDASAGV